MIEKGPVWHVAREYAGIAEAGGVKDVVRGLAEAQARAGAEPVVVLPRYGFLPAALWEGRTVASFSLSLPDQDQQNAFFEEPVRIIEAAREGVRLLFVDSPRFAAARDVYTYTAEDERENHWRTRGTGHWDSHQKNLLLQRAALEAALASGQAPKVVHCHDGHAGFLPALMREDPRYAGFYHLTAVVLTIHNAGAGYHQEVWDQGFAELLTGLPGSVVNKGLIGTTVDPLLLAGEYAALTTVSTWYAAEVIAEREAEVAAGLGRALRERHIPLDGITNGIDPTPWDPRYPDRSGIPYGFDPRTDDLEGKRRCRAELNARLGVPAGTLASLGPLYAFIGRLTGQKGIDVLFEALKRLVRADHGRRFIVLGQGEKEKEAMLAWLASDQAGSQGRLHFIPRYDRQLASLIYASSDFFLIPSAYEPCGLTDLMAQLMGAIPVVHRVGGLWKVRDGETGFCYDEHTPSALEAAVERTSALFHQGSSGLLAQIRKRAFAEIFTEHTWDRVLANGYGPLYERAIAGQHGR
jgi:starch synthase